MNVLVVLRSMAALALQELNALNFPKEVSKKRVEAAKRQRERWAQSENEKQLECIMNKYDKSGNRKLDRTELAMMLQDMAGGQAPTDEECSFVLHMADASDKQLDGYIGKHELEAAVHIYNELLAHRDEIQEHMKKYDFNQSGKLELEQLRALLTDLNDGNPPALEEVQWVMKQADGLAGVQTGGVNATELKTAISLWYSHVDANSWVARVFDKRT
jgi:Ca2+-binding EF-hand superfamily protein